MAFAAPQALFIFLKIHAVGHRAKTYPSEGRKAPAFRPGICACKGRPAQAFNRPRTSRTTSRASLVVRHQCRGSKGSREAARTMARPWPEASLRQSRPTRRVWGLVV